MRLIKRVNAILTAQLNDLVDTFEKPEQLLKQAIREMEAALERAVQSTAKAIAGEKRLSRELDGCRAQAQSWHERAIQFVRNNDDVGARDALVRKIEKEKLADSLGRLRAQAEQTNVRLRRQLDALRGRLAEARHHLASLVARQRAAEARRQFVRALGEFDTDLQAFRRFDDLSRRVDDAEAEADVQSELCGTEIDEIGPDDQVKADLRVLKEQHAAETEDLAKKTG